MSAVWQTDAEVDVAGTVVEAEEYVEAIATLEVVSATPVKDEALATVTQVEETLYTGTEAAGLDVTAL